MDWGGGVGKEWYEKTTIKRTVQVSTTRINAGVASIWIELREVINGLGWSLEVQWVVQGMWFVMLADSGMDQLKTCKYIYFQPKSDHKVEPSSCPKTP